MNQETITALSDSQADLEVTHIRRYPTGIPPTVAGSYPQHPVYHAINPFCIVYIGPKESKQRLLLIDLSRY